MTLEALSSVLRETRAILARSDNDFTWSSWQDGEQALAEIDDLLRQVATGRIADLGSLNVLFAPTGPLQEVSLESGWGEEFLALAAKFDSAIADL